MDEKIISILNDIQKHLQKHDARFDSLDSKVGSLDSKVDKLEGRMDSLDTKMDSLDTRMNSLDTKVDKLEGRMDSLETKVDKLETSLKEDIKLLGQELHIEIQAVYDNVEELRNDINAMEIMTTKNAFDIAKLKSVR